LPRRSASQFPGDGLSQALEKAATMANQASTTQFYDRRRDDVTLGEVETLSI
jgi:hypothetical protein